MDMKLSGSGVITAGDYEKVRICGSGKMDGLVRCDSLHISGSVNGCELQCREDVIISGSMRLDGNLTADEMETGGSVSIDGDCKVKNEIKCSGSARIEGAVKCGKLCTSGSIDVTKGIEAEEIKIFGSVYCGDLMNAEKINIETKPQSKVNIESIGGNSISIYRNSCKRKSLISRLPLLSRIIGSSGGTAVIKNYIEGDTVAVEGVKAKSVTGRIVTIGEDCKIDLVQYSEQIEIHPKAKVGRQEKI